MLALGLSPAVTVTKSQIIVTSTARVELIAVGKKSKSKLSEEVLVLKVNLTFFCPSCDFFFYYSVTFPATARWLFETSNWKKKKM